VYRGNSAKEAGLVYTNKVSVTAADDFDVFYQKWRSPIRRSLAFTLGDVGLADEAVDEAMTRAVAQWETVKHYDRPEGWLYRVGLNWARGIFRKRRYELLSDLEASSQVWDDPLPDPDLIEAVGRLSLKLRSVVVARYHLEFSTAEVAEALGISEGTVKSRLSRALHQLSRELGESL
jgi:RNA polymerase sigma-70 factor (ECF subfamily)